MADDKKNIPEAAPPAEAPAPTVENAAVPEQPAPEPVLTNAETVMLEHEGQAALFEMGEAVPLVFQHDRLCVGQSRLGSGLLRHDGTFYRRSGRLGERSCLGNVFLIICHLQTSFLWHEKSQSADWLGGSDLPSWFYI